MQTNEKVKENVLFISQRMEIPRPRGRAPKDGNGGKKVWNKTTGEWEILSIKPDHENVQQKKRGDAAGKVVIVDGEICIDHCGSKKCCRRNLPITHFAPNPTTYKRRFSEFEEACNTGDIASLTVLKTSQCKRCREINHNTKTTGGSADAACTRMVAELKKRMAEFGCQICGIRDINVLEADHPGRQCKEHEVFNVRYWSAKYGHDGPNKMKEEFMKTRPLCKNCHPLQDSHNVTKGVDSTTMPTNTQREKQAKLQREYNEENLRHNNKRKREVGKCFHCDKECIQGNEICFHWAHRDECEKVKAVSKYIGAGTPKTQIPRIDAEISKCELKCANCHYLHDTLPRSKQGMDLWDELLKRKVIPGNTS